MDRLFPKLSKQDVRRGMDVDFDFVLVGQDFARMHEEFTAFKDKLSEWCQFVEIRAPPKMIADDEVAIEFE